MIRTFEVVPPKKEVIAADYPVWQEGAGSLLLLAAAQASGLLAALPQIIPTTPPEMPDRLAQSRTNCRQQLLQTLLFRLIRLKRS